MRIEFDPTNPTEAAAVRAMLTAMAAPETPWVAKRYVINATGDADLPIKGEGGEAPTLAPTGAETDPGHQGTTAPREQVVSDITQLPATDSNGEPHDPRIHSTPPKLNADGTWRAKRGVTAEQIAEVRAEREAALACGGVIESAETTFVGEVPSEQTVAAAFEEPVTAPLCEDPDDPKHVQVDPIVTAPPAPPVTTAPPAPTLTGSPSFLDVMKAITAAQKDGKIDTAKVKELCSAVGAGESTMGLNGPDNGGKRVAFMALLAEETK